ncbi:MAG: ABC transporter substrate-binding protein, partial [Thermomicrobiales bacterium]
MVGAALTSVGAILAACGGSTPTTAPTAAVSAATTGAAPAPTAATTGSAPAPSAAAAPRGQTKGELRISIADDFPTAVDGVRSGYEVVFAGMAETLMRITPEGKLVPWLAESVTNSDASTWRVTLRKNAKFWDGSPVTADAVAAAFKVNWEKQPAADGLISKNTQVTVIDPVTLEFKTPQPTGTFANAISAQQFVIHAGGGTVMTGPYRATHFETDRTMTLEAFADHWAGAPPIAKITVTKLTDQNARALALQSGDLDMIYGIPPEIVKNFGSGFESWSVPSRQVDILQPLNFTKPPFDDPKVRQALALAIDRKSLLTVALDGQGAVATGMFPPNSGVDVVTLQSTDVNQAKQLLDQAGWQIGSDGIRSKGGTRLTAKLISY